MGATFSVKVRVHLGPFRSDEVEVQLCHGVLDAMGDLAEPKALPLSATGSATTDGMLFTGELPCRASGHFGFSVRVPGQRLNLARERLRRQDPTVRIAATHHRLQASTLRLERAAVETVASRRTRLERTSARLNALSPLAVLSRGYALVYLQGGAADGT